MKERTMHLLDILIKKIEQAKKIDEFERYLEMYLEVCINTSEEEYDR